MASSPDISKGLCGHGFKICFSNECIKPEGYYRNIAKNLKQQNTELQTKLDDCIERSDKYPEIAIENIESSIKSFTTNVLHSVCDSEHTILQFVKYLKSQAKKYAKDKEQ